MKKNHNFRFFVVMKRIHNSQLLIVKWLGGGLRTDLRFVYHALMASQYLLSFFKCTSVLLVCIFRHCLSFAHFEGGG